MTQFVGKTAIVSFFAAMWFPVFGWGTEFPGRIVAVMFISLLVAFIAFVAQSTQEMREEHGKERERERDALRRLQNLAREDTDASGTV